MKNDILQQVLRCLAIALTSVAAGLLLVAVLRHLSVGETNHVLYRLAISSSCLFVFLGAVLLRKFARDRLSLKCYIAAAVTMLSLSVFGIAGADYLALTSYQSALERIPPGY